MILFKLAWGYVKQNRKWSISTLLSGIIWVALLSAIATFATSYNLMTRNTIEQIDGNHHFEAVNLSDYQIENFNKIDEVEKVSVIPLISYATVRDIEITNIQKPYIKIMGLDPQNYRELGYLLTSGQPAKNPNEIVLSNSILLNTKQEIQLGDIITVDLGKRLVDGKEIYDQSLKVKQPESTNSAPINLESFDKKEEREYRVVGFFSDTIFSKEFDDAGFQAMVNEQNSISKQNLVQFRLSNVSARSVNRVKQVATDLNISVTSKDILSTYFIGGQNIFSSIYGTALFATVLLGSIVMLAALLVIYQSFSMITVELSTQLGVMGSIGATFRQRQIIIISIGQIIMLIALPIGLVLGYIGSYLLLNNFADVFNSRLTANLVTVQVSPISFLIIFLGIVISTAVVTSIPAYQTNKLTAIEAIRYNKVSNRQIGAYKLPKWVKAIEHQLAIRNFMRNRSLYVAVIISLVTSVVLIVSMASVVDLTAPFNDKVNRVTSYSVNDNKMSMDEINTVISELRVHPDISSAGLWREIFLELLVSPDQLTDEYKEIIKKLDNQYTFLQVWILDDLSMENFFGKRVDGDVTNKVILVDNVEKTYDLDYGEQKFRHSIFNLEGMDSLKFTLANSDGEQKSLLIDYVMNSASLGLVYSEPTIIFSSSYVMNSQNSFVKELSQNLENKYVENKMIYANGNSYDLVEKALISTLQEHASYNPVNILNEYKVKLVYYRSQQFYSIINYSFVFLVIMIALINIFNTISTNLKVRQREFSILRSCGMSPYSFYRMILFEAFIYGFITAIVSIPISIVVSRIVKKYISFGFQTSVVSFSTTVFIGMVILVAVLLISFLYSLRAIKKKQIIESIML
ncbi:MAG: FtsX-like permease family protein [Erysipelothrix sp.]|nr:FtsX-like permease family protein [Erysipelothrix sp.]